MPVRAEAVAESTPGSAANVSETVLSHAAHVIPVTRISRSVMVFPPVATWGYCEDNEDPPRTFTLWFRGVENASSWRQHSDRHGGGARIPKGLDRALYLDEGSAQHRGRGGARSLTPDGDVSLGDGDGLAATGSDHAERAHARLFRVDQGHGLHRGQSLHGAHEHVREALGGPELHGHR